MVKVIFDCLFEKKIKRIRSSSVKNRVKMHIEKIVRNPEVGKPMRYARKGTREDYVAPFRISYSYRNDTITFLDVYHKKKQ